MRAVAMNRQGAKGIEWTDATWNPITGCTGGCPYCYARSIAKRFGDDFTPKFHAERLGEPAKLRKPSKIFVGSMGDIMDAAFRNPVIAQIIQVAQDNPRHTFQFLSRRPTRYGDFSWPENCWLGATAERAPDLAGKAMHLRREDIPMRFISAEPWLPAPGDSLLERRDLDELDWLIVGAMTGPGAKPVDEGSVLALIAAADKAGVPVFCKRSVHHICDRQEWPSATQTADKKGADGE